MALFRLKSIWFSQSAYRLQLPLQFNDELYQWLSPFRDSLLRFQLPAKISSRQNKKSERGDSLEFNHSVLELFDEKSGSTLKEVSLKFNGSALEIERGKYLSIKWINCNPYILKSNSSYSLNRNALCSFWFTGSTDDSISSGLLQFGRFQTSRG